jgi:hypothetical protein
MVLIFSHPKSAALAAKANGSALIKMRSKLSTAVEIGDFTNNRQRAVFLIKIGGRKMGYLSNQIKPDRPTHPPVRVFYDPCGMTRVIHPQFDIPAMLGRKSRALRETHRSPYGQRNLIPVCFQYAQYVLR